MQKLYSDVLKRENICKGLKIFFSNEPLVKIFKNIDLKSQVNIPIRSKIISDLVSDIRELDLQRFSR